jgi:hypothetical protein
VSTRRRGGGYAAWVAANGLGEALGLGTTFVLGWTIAPQVSLGTGPYSAIATAGAAIGLGMVLEGIVVGAAQALALRRLASIPRLAWTWATAVGAGIAWTIGMAPSTCIALSTASADAGPIEEPSLAVTMPLAAGLGLVTGPILGAAQWAVLRRQVDRAGRWLWANALAWAVGMPIIFLGMDLVPWTGHPAAVALGVYAVCGAAGLAVGAIHGRTLLDLLDCRVPVNRELGDV